MSHTMELIVEGYVKLSGRKALEDLKTHRRRLADELKSLNRALDLSSSIKLGGSLMARSFARQKAKAVTIC